MHQINHLKFRTRNWIEVNDESRGTYNVNFDVNNTTDSFKFKAKITGQTGNDGTKDVEIMVPLKYLSNFRRTLEMPLIKCEVNLILTWSSSCVLIATGTQN